MDPKLRQQVFIAKNLPAIFGVVMLVLILPVVVFMSQSQTRFQPQAVEIVHLAGEGQNKVNSSLNRVDYKLLMQCFGKADNTSNCSPVDLNHDGAVNGIDYNLFIRGHTEEKAQ